MHLLRFQSVERLNIDARDPRERPALGADASALGRRVLAAARVAVVMHMGQSVDRLRDPNRTPPPSGSAGRKQ